ncbi:hypothetical protein J2S13_000875 [Oikeobacillus pervagus]|uniref:Uncharacterized protein n=1 Tax=Oikeobacillus pervagus TaxID=1325931 RepID=A0AAJ1T208_9BACI|nr:hypothetical protein [Oikeobacillus pervagus]
MQIPPKLVQIIMGNTQNTWEMIKSGKLRNASGKNKTIRDEVPINSYHNISFLLNKKERYAWIFN